MASGKQSIFVVEIALFWVKEVHTFYSAIKSLGNAIFRNEFFEPLLGYICAEETRDSGEIYRVVFL
jgi:hypothetical protein